MSAADKLTKLIELQTGGGDIEEVELERYLRNNAEAIAELIEAAEEAAQMQIVEQWKLQEAIAKIKGQP